MIDDYRELAGKRVKETPKLKLDYMIPDRGEQVFEIDPRRLFVKISDKKERDWHLTVGVQQIICFAYIAQIKVKRVKSSIPRPLECGRGYFL